MRHVCGVVIKARDEEKHVKNSLLSLISQTVVPYIVVVNDGSLDKTGEIASKYADVVVNLPRHAESWAGRPELARVVNAGLSILENEEIDFVMFSDGEAIYPSNYIEEIVRRMKCCKVTVASGMAEHEASRSFSPRGCGRLVNAEWFRTVGFRYPENYGFEAYLIYKALSQGKKVAVYSDLKFKLQRKTQVFPNKLYLWGKGMKALNYSFSFVLGRALLFLLKSPRCSFALLRGYFSPDVKQYDDIKDFVPNFQRRQLIHRISELFYV